MEGQGGGCGTELSFADVIRSLGREDTRMGEQKERFGVDDGGFGHCACHAGGGGPADVNGGRSRKREVDAGARGNAPRCKSQIGGNPPFPFSACCHLDHSIPCLLLLRREVESSFLPAPLPSPRLPLFVLMVLLPFSSSSSSRERGWEGEHRRRRGRHGGQPGSAEGPSSGLHGGPVGIQSAPRVPALQVECFGSLTHQGPLPISHYYASPPHPEDAHHSSFFGETLTTALVGFPIAFVSY